MYAPAFVDEIKSRCKLNDFVQTGQAVVAIELEECMRARDCVG